MKKLIVGAAAAATIALSIAPAPAMASYSEDAQVYRVAEFYKPWQCKDRDSGWSGLRRWTKASAVIDCASYNSRA